MRLFVPFFILLCGMAAAPDTQPTDLDRLQGTWKLVSLESAGVKLPESFLATHRVTLVITGETERSIAQNHPDHPDVGTIKLDEAKVPKEIVWTDKQPEPGQQPVTWSGIYKIEGDTYTQCMARPGSPRPKAFASTDKSTQLRAFQRVRQ